MMKAYGMALVLLVGAVFSGPARADDAAGAACAAQLGREARAIYDAARPKVGTGDLKGVVTAATKALVMSGSIPRSAARDSAEAAGACLKLI